jgi:ABC-type multidrug transport system fused ATPase/permease subunit
MLRLDWQLTLVSLAIVPLVVATFICLPSESVVNRHPSRNGRARSLLQAQEGLSSIRMVHAFGREEFEVLQFQQQARQSLQANLRLTLTNVNSALVISTLMVVGTPRCITSARCTSLRHAHARIAARFQCLFADALSAARVPHLHRLGNGRRHRLAQNVVLKCWTGRTMCAIHRMRLLFPPPEARSHFNP